MLQTGNCLNSLYGPIAEWKVSSINDMSHMFSSETSASAAVFNADIGKWDVSSVTAMTAMFLGAESFNGDISKWDVSRVTTMYGMFRKATLFNGNISKWDVSMVTNMDFMFLDAKSFQQKLCGTSWVNSKASKDRMFEGSSGSISEIVGTTGTTRFSPQSKGELHRAIKACL